MNKKLSHLLMLAMPAALLITSCGKNIDPSTTLSVSSLEALGPATGNIRLIATDDPFTYDNVASAKVSVDKIDAVTNNAVVTNISSKQMVLDLVNLKNGMVSVLADVTIPPGQYKELQFYISSGSVDLKNGSHYNLTVPSGSQTGLKVSINPSINIATQASSDIIIDFDLSRSFVPQGNTNSSNGITGFNFKPVLRGTNLTTAGTVTGKVFSDNTTPSNTADDVALAGAVVTISQNGSAVQTAVTDSNGVYKVVGLPEGAYTLDVSAPGFTSAATANLSIVAGNTNQFGNTLLAKNPPSTTATTTP